MSRNIQNVNIESAGQVYNTTEPVHITNYYSADGRLQSHMQGGQNVHGGGGGSLMPDGPASGANRPAQQGASPAYQASGRQQSHMQAGQNVHGGSLMPDGPLSASCPAPQGASSAYQASGRQQSHMQAGQNVHGGSLMPNGPPSASRPAPQGASSAYQGATPEEFNDIDMGVRRRPGLDPDN